VCVGGEPGGNGAQVLHGDGPSPGHAEPSGGRAVSAPLGHAAQQDRLRAAAAHQTEPGDGDRHLQEAAGGRGDVSEGPNAAIKPSNHQHMLKQEHL